MSEYDQLNAWVPTAGHRTEQECVAALDELTAEAVRRGCQMKRRHMEQQRDGEWLGFITYHDPCVREGIITPAPWWWRIARWLHLR